MIQLGMTASDSAHHKLLLAQFRLFVYLLHRSVLPAKQLQSPSAC